MKNIIVIKHVYNAPLRNIHDRVSHYTFNVDTGNVYYIYNQQYEDDSSLQINSKISKRTLGPVSKHSIMVKSYQDCKEFLKEQWIENDEHNKYTVLTEVKKYKFLNSLPYTMEKLRQFMT